MFMNKVVWLENLLYRQEKMFLNCKIEKIEKMEN